MKFTTVQIRAIRDSFAAIEPQADEVAALFYAKLFAGAPELRALFKHDMVLQRRKFMQTLEALVAVLNHPDRLLTMATDLGHRHVFYKVRSADYVSVGTALLGALRESLGERFTPEVESAWRELYDLLSTAMQGE